jgi:hypothetical protein
MKTYEIVAAIEILVFIVCVSSSSSILHMFYIKHTCQAILFASVLLNENVGLSKCVRCYRT